MRKLEQFIQEKQLVSEKVRQFQQRQKDIGGETEQLNDNIRMAMLNEEPFAEMQNQLLKLQNEAENLRQMKALATGQKLDDLAGEVLAEQKNYFNEAQERLHDLRQQDAENYQKYLDQQKDIVQQWVEVKKDCSQRFQKVSAHLGSMANQKMLRQYDGQKLEKYDASKGVG